MIFWKRHCVATVAAWPDEDLTGAEFGPFRLESRIGGGGMGEVYRARDTRLARTVAIKVLRSHVAVDEPARERFEREARVVAGLNHPHICTLHDIGTYQAPTGPGPVPYLVMEFLNGETLADRLAKGPLPLEDALDCAIEIASALDTAHRAAIVHRDLKPQNVMLTSAGAKLLDFGLAKATAPPPQGASLTSDSELTTPGTIIGTVYYMAPEQLEGLPTDARTDLFAFGCVLYEMLSGKKAFDGRSGASLTTAIMSAEPTPIRDLVPSLPHGVDQLIGRCLAKSPDERWQSAADLVDELRRIAGAVRSARDSGWFRRFISEHRVAAAGVLLTVLLSAAAAAFLSPPAPPSVSPPRRGRSNWRCSRFAWSETRSAAMSTSASASRIRSSPSSLRFARLGSVRPRRSCATPIRPRIRRPSPKRSASGTCCSAPSSGTQKRIASPFSSFRVRTAR